MRTMLALITLSATLGCNPESEAARVDKTDISVAFDDNGVVATLDVEGIAKQKDKLQHELWTDLRIFGHVWTPTLQEDGTFKNENWRIWSAHAPFSTDTPTEFRVGEEPEGWEEGWENRSLVGGGPAFPEGELEAGDVVSIGIEALNPDDNNVRATLGIITLKSVP